jgi:hypothetical protein
MEINVTINEETIICPSMSVTTDLEMYERILPNKQNQSIHDGYCYAEFAGNPFTYENREIYGRFLLYLEPDIPNSDMSIGGETWINNQITELLKMPNCQLRDDR